MCTRGLFGGSDGGTTWRSVIVTSCQGSGEIAAGTTATWSNVPMLIPPVAPSRLAGCSIIDANYVLKVC